MGISFEHRGWGPLTHELEHPESPVRVFLDTLLTHVRPVYQQYREAAGDLVVTPASDGSVNPSTLGTAFDWMIRFRLHPQPDLGLAWVGTGRRLAPAFAELAEVLDAPAPDPLTWKSDEIKFFSGPVSGSSVQLPTLARACWALALMTELYRAGGLAQGSPLQALRRAERIDAADLLGLAPAEAIEQMLELLRLAETRLLPKLNSRQGEWALGPTFAGSRLMKGDADLVASGMLLEIKTTYGKATKRPGVRHASLERATLQQLLGYALMDFDDRFRITELALYSARYGYLASWKLTTLLNLLAEAPLTLANLRTGFAVLLLEGRNQPTSVTRNIIARTTVGSFTKKQLRLAEVAKSIPE